jgi:hypothetical protein
VIPAVWEGVERFFDGESPWILLIQVTFGARFDSDATVAASNFDLSAWARERRAVPGGSDGVLCPSVTRTRGRHAGYDLVVILATASIRDRTWSFS